MSKTAFVTGGTGFLGINLLHALCKEGWKVTALHRPTSNLAYIKDLPIQLVEGSITDKTTLEKAIPKGTNVVFHLAGDTNMWSKQNARQTAINVDGTRNMIEASAGKGVSTFIHTSSISAWGRISGPVDEGTPKRGADSWLNYEKTKWMGEQEALKGMDHGMKVVVINPAAIVGPFDENTWGSIFTALRDGEVPGIPPGSNSFVHVNDVVQAHILAVDKGQNGHNYIVSGENTSNEAFFTEFAKNLKIGKVPSEIPKLLLHVAARLNVIIAFFTNKEPTITPEIVELMSRKDYQFSNAKALKELGYNITPWQQGVQENYQWMTKVGLL